MEEKKKVLVKGKVEASSIKTHGIKIDGKWLNMEEGLTEEVKAKLKEVQLKIKKGDIVKVVQGVKGGYVDIEITEVAENEDDFLKFEQLCEMAHNKYQDRISIYSEELHPILDKKEEVIGWKAKGIVELHHANHVQVFTAYGYATEANVSDNMVKQMLHMADTRSKARALRILLAHGPSKEEMEQGE